MNVCTGMYGRFVTSIFSIGAAVAAFPLLSGPVLDRLGRKWSIFLGAVLFLSLIHI